MLNYTTFMIQKGVVHLYILFIFHCCIVVVFGWGEGEPIEASLFTTIYLFHYLRNFYFIKKN